MSSEGRESQAGPPAGSEPPALLTQIILSWIHEDHGMCGLQFCSVLHKLLPLAQTKNFQASDTPCVSPCR